MISQYKYSLAAVGYWGQYLSTKVFTISMFDVKLNKL